MSQPVIFFARWLLKKNMDLLEFGKFAEENDDIDILIDKRQAELANKSKKSDC